MSAAEIEDAVAVKEPIDQGDLSKWVLWGRGLGDHCASCRGKRAAGGRDTCRRGHSTA